mmetsp:Transcript_9380/g.15549  ORF Transcript_9380/g.15549 Transcript_9380/m.15549 type:complete len:85 (-) Transcript_9380:82-336(-)
MTHLATFPKPARSPLLAELNRYELLPDIQEEDATDCPQPAIMWTCDGSSENEDDTDDEDDRKRTRQLSSSGVKKLTPSLPKSNW